MPSCQRIEVEKLDKAKLEVGEEINEASFEEVDVHQDDAAAWTTDDVQDGRRAEQDQERLFEAAPDVKEINEGLTRPRRVPKPNSRYSPEDYDLNYVRAAKRNKSRSSP